MQVKQLIKQFLKFQVVGGIAFAIDYLGLMLLSQLFGLEPVVAAAVSYIISTVFNYYASMKFVFTHQDDMSRRREFMIFFVLSVIGLGLNELIIWIGTEYWGDGAFAVTASKLVATVIVGVFNFFTRRYFLDADSPHNQTDDAPSRADDPSTAR
ncbi:MAG: GtrA family protein [Olegusella sp.]|nr:GtrA family protein [Olegusella sp.]